MCFWNSQIRHTVPGTLHTLFCSSQLEHSELVRILSLPVKSQFPVAIETIRESLNSEMVINKIFPEEENQEKLIGDLTIKLCRLYGLLESEPVSIAIEVDR